MGARRESDGWTFLVAAAPMIFLLAVEGLAWILAAAVKTTEFNFVALCALAIGLVAGLLAPFAIGAIRREGVVAWSLVSIGLTAVGLIFGAIFWWEAVIGSCGHDCFG